MTKPKLFSVGDIVRYDSGPTALMRITTLREGHGGAIARYWGAQCMGGFMGAYHEKCSYAAAADLAKWQECADWRRETERAIKKRGGDFVAGAHEGW